MKQYWNNLDQTIICSIVVVVVDSLIDVIITGMEKFNVYQWRVNTDKEGTTIVFDWLDRTG